MESLGWKRLVKDTRKPPKTPRSAAGTSQNVGTIVTYNVGWPMSLPKFALIVRRTPKMIETVVLPTVKESSDGYGFQGHERPVSRVRIPEGVSTTRTRMGKHGFSVGGHYTKIWDGTSRWFDHLD